MDFSALTSYLDSLEVIGIPGVDCIIQQGHETIYRHMSGYSDREAGIPVMGSERGFFYSCTKPVVCVAAMQLYERGLFLLTDELGDYMPEFKEMTITRQMPNGERVLEKAKNPIRIVDLFTMTAGFKTYLKAEPLRRVREETNAGWAPPGVGTRHPLVLFHSLSRYFGSADRGIDRPDLWRVPASEFVPAFGYDPKQL